MLSFFTSLLPTSFLPGWLSLEMNPLDCVLQGELFTSLFPVVSTWAVPTWIWPNSRVSLACRADWSVWDLCALLLDESAFISRGTQVRDLSFARFGFGDSVMDSQLGILKRSTSVFCMSYLTSPTSCSDKNEKDTLNQKTHSHQRTNTNGLYGMIQFFFVTVILTVVGSRVASLVVLEFCLRAVSGWVTAGPVRNHLCDRI